MDGEGGRRLARVDFIRMQLYLDTQRPPLILRPLEIGFQLLRDIPQFLTETVGGTQLAEGSFRPYALPLVLLCGLDLGAAQTEVALHEEVEGLLAEEGGEVGAEGVDVAAGFDADGVEFAFEDATDAVDFAGRQRFHKLHDGLAVGGEEELAVWLVLVAAYFGEFSVGSDAGGDGDFGFLVDLGAELADGFVGREVVFFAVGGEVQVGLVAAGAFEAGVVLGEDGAHFLGFGGVLCEVHGHAYELGAELHGDEAGHARAAAELAGVVVAGGEDALADGHGDMAQLGAVELLDCGIEGIAVDVDDDLGEVSGQLELGQVVVGAA